MRRAVAINSFLLKTTTILHCTIASCMPWCSLPWKRNEFPMQACAASVPHHKKRTLYSRHICRKLRKIVTLHDESGRAQLTF